MDISRSLENEDQEVEQLKAAATNRELPAGAESQTAGQFRHPGGNGCVEKRRLLADYVERIQALAIEAELLLNSLDRDWEEDRTWHWYQMEQARINCDVARLALAIHTRDHLC